MAIAPPSDIVLDVANAASRTDLDTARAELRAKAGAMAAARGGGETFAPARPSPVGKARAEPPKNAAFVKFEAMVLQTFMQSMMPQDAESVYGEGLAGDMWKSFLANELGETLAARGGIGIADRIMPDYYKQGDATVPLTGIDRSAGKTEKDEQANLSAALVERLSRASMQPLLGLDAPEATGVAARRNPA